MKFDCTSDSISKRLVALRGRAWIEIVTDAKIILNTTVALRGRAWIEIILLVRIISGV